VRARFWGTRGSLPVSLTWRDVRDRLVRALVHAAPHNLDTAGKAQAFIAKHFEFSLSHTFGGHSSCVELETAASPEVGQYFVCDMGSGARAFGEHVLARQSRRPATVNVFMSHMHWDHIMGFPFFRPAYRPEYRVRIHGCHEQLEHAFRLQQEPPCFPVPFGALAASIEFVRLTPGETHLIDGMSVTPMLQLHSGDSFGYRFEADGRAVVYTTDSEHKLEEAGESEKYAFFFRDADLVIFDAMYSLADAISVKADWGHSSNVIGVELCQLAGAKRLALYHHEPANDDQAIARILDETRRLEELTRDGEALEILAAYDGLELEL
jgi:phosphoribosyl 1,2-cyclic phosphodiesterase